MPMMHGKNLAKIKLQNLESIKRILFRYAPLSRAEIAERLELTPPTITNIVAELIQQGVVQELTGPSNAVATRSVGRKPINIDLVPGSRLALGISLGRDFTHYCITDLRGGIRAQGSYDLLSEDYNTMVKQLLRLLNTLEKRYPAEWERLIGIGITVPGIVNAHTGVIKNLGTERVSWCNQPFGETISQATHLPVRLENNVRARACAISLFRPNLLAEDTTFAFCHVAWGIACPVVLSNQSFRGQDAAAGEIGKMILDPNGPELPDCGMPGSLEALSSMRAVLEYCRQALRAGECTVLAELCSDPEQLTLEQVLEAQTKGDPAVCRILDRGMFYLGIALANIVGFLNPHLIFLSGPMFRNRENFDTVERSLRTYAFRSSDEKLQLVYVDLGEYGGAVGAAASCIEKYFLRE